MKLLKIIFCTFLFLFPGLLKAQKVVAEWERADGLKTKVQEFVDPVSTIYVYLNSLPNNYFKVGGIDVYDNYDKTLRNTIDVKDCKPFNSWNPLVWIEDWNFDEFLDIALLTWVGACGRQQYKLWIFKLHTGKYHLNYGFDALHSPYRIDSLKLLHSDFQFGSSHIGHAVYYWERDSLTLLASEEYMTTAGDHLLSYNVLRWLEGDKIEEKIIHRNSPLWREVDYTHMNTGGECPLWEKRKSWMKRIFDD